MQNSHRSLPTIAEESKEKRVRLVNKRRSGGFSSAFERYKKASSGGEEELDARFCLEEEIGESNTSSSQTGSEEKN